MDVNPYKAEIETDMIGIEPIFRGTTYSDKYLNKLNIILPVYKVAEVCSRIQKIEKDSSAILNTFADLLKLEKIENKVHPGALQLQHIVSTSANAGKWVGNVYPAYKVHDYIKEHPEHTKDREPLDFLKHLKGCNDPHDTSHTRPNYPGIKYVLKEKLAYSPNEVLQSDLCDEKDESRLVIALNKEGVIFVETHLLKYNK